MAKKVLVVDDDVRTVGLVRLYLERDGYKVLTAHDGNEALLLARESHPDLMSTLITPFLCPHNCAVLAPFLPHPDCSTRNALR